MTYLNPRYSDKKNSFGPRVRFNWGYHDAVHETKLGNPRNLHVTTHNTSSISPAFDVMYFEGYKAGLVEASYTENSEPAWLIYRDNLTEAQLSEIYQAEILAYMAGCEKKYRQYRMPYAIKNATKICGRQF